MLELIRRFGLDEVQLEIRVMRAPASVIDATVATWDLPKVGARSESADPLGQLPHRPLDSPIPDDDSSAKSHAHLVVETQLPVTQQVLGKSAAARVIDGFRTAVNTRVETSPRVTLINGQSATIESATQRPFVVGLRKLAGDNYEPRIRIEREGWVMRLRPILRKPGSVWLDYEISYSEVTKVTTREVARPGHPDLAIQVPEVATSRIEGSVEFELGKTLFLGELSTKSAKGKPESMLMAIQASVKAGVRPRTREGRGLGSSTKARGDVATDPTRATLAELANRFNRLMDQQRVAEARLVAKQAAELAPASAVAEQMRWKADFAARIVQNRGETPEDWNQVKTRRLRSHLSVLDRPVTLKFSDAPLDKVIESLAEAVNANIVIKNSALHAAGVSRETRVSIKTEQSIKLGSALNLILKPLRLAYLVEDELVVITRDQDKLGEPYACVYNVADLVVKIPRVVHLKAGLREPEKQPAAELDFKSILELITTTIEPGSWAGKGGVGTIEPYPTSLSLVVLQTRAVHEQISDLLDQIRRVQDVQVALELRTFRVDSDRFREIWPGDGDELTATLIDTEAARFTHATTSRERTGVLGKPAKVTVFSGQAIELTAKSIESRSTAGKSRFQFIPLVSPDRRSVSIRMAVGEDVTRAIEVARPISISDGHTLILDFSRLASGTNAEPGRTRTLLVVTPRIIVVEEEEGWR